MNYDGVVTFPSSFFALRSEKVTQKADYDCKLIPCPRELSSSCAVSLAFEAAQVEHIAELIGQKRIKFEAIYLYRAKGSGEASSGRENAEREIIVWAEQ